MAADYPQLTWPQLRLLQLIHEPFAYGQSPVFQHVNAIAWHELKSPTGEPLEPREVYYELSALDLVRPPARRGRAWQLRDDTTIWLTLRGLIRVDNPIAKLPCPPASRGRADE